MKEQICRKSKNCEDFVPKSSKLYKENYAKKIGTLLVHTKVKARKKEQHNFFLDNIRGPPKQRIRIEKQTDT